ncbi:MAG: type II 3-dehydroquinate dehydratase [Arsenophonus sp.]|nr:MAG: type II 3-dehydroquinate dehydratase [Arsenophonus sp.]
MKFHFHVLILNGPNLNMLGKREEKIYGIENLKNINNNIIEKAKQLDIYTTFFQSNAEYQLINKIHNAYKKIDFILINPGALAHSSIALRDAILSVNIDFYEIHISNIYKREKFRHFSYLSDIAVGVICGFGQNTYLYALDAAYQFLIKNKMNVNKS